MSLRTDKNTGILYTYHNIPISSKRCKKGHLVSIQNSKGYYKIFEENHDIPELSWYNNTKVCGKYAVFKWVNTSVDNGFYQQITPWYVRFGYAVHRMCEIATE